MNAKTNGELPIKLGDVLQVGLVVRDLKKSMETYWTLLGIGPWKIYTYAPPMLCEATLRGTRTEYSMRIACAQAGEQVEIMRQLDKFSVRHHLAAKGHDKGLATKGIDVRRDRAEPGDEFDRGKGT